MSATSTTVPVPADLLDRVLVALMVAEDIAEEIALSESFTMSMFSERITEVFAALHGEGSMFDDEADDFSELYKDVEARAMAEARDTLAAYRAEEWQGQERLDKAMSKLEQALSKLDETKARLDQLEEADDAC